MCVICTLESKIFHAHIFCDIGLTSYYIFIFRYFFTPVCICLCPWKPEDPLRLELNVAVSCLVWLLGTKFWSPGVAASVPLEKHLSSPRT